MRKGLSQIESTFAAYEIEARTAGCHGVILPSSLVMIDRLGLRSGVDAIVGRSMGKHMLAPAELLTRLSENPLKPSALIVVFTDQLVSVVDAPLLVRQGKQAQYVSSIEYILNVHHQCPLFAISSDGLEYLPVGAAPAQVFSLVTGHLRANDRLGNDWMVKNWQIQRSPQDRRFQQRRRIRAMRSSVMHMMGRDQYLWNPGHDDKLRTLDDLYRNR
jgi:hypothetical protein